MVPFHAFIFSGMVDDIVRMAESPLPDGANAADD
jgi:hypothetical protein